MRNDYRPCQREKNKFSNEDNTGLPDICDAKAWLGLDLSTKAIAHHYFIALRHFSTNRGLR